LLVGAKWLLTAARRVRVLLLLASRVELIWNIACRVTAENETVYASAVHAHWSLLSLHAGVL
jgi:hypothetical protein